MIYFYKREKMCYNTLEFTHPEIIMNKKRVAGLILLLPLGLLAACGGGGPSSLSISQNWYDSATTSQTDYSKEELEYTVKFTPPSVPGDCTVTYEEGTYKTSFETSRYEYADGSSANVYCYQTSLNISGRYNYKDVASKEFDDFVTSTVYFRMAGEGLVPIESKKEIKSTSPVANPSESVFYEDIHIIYQTVYSTADSYKAALTSAKIKAILPDSEDPERSDPDKIEPAEVKIDCNGSFFDNEEILFALRGLDMSAASSFYTIDPRTYDVTGTKFLEAPVATAFTPANDSPLTIDGTAVTGEIQAYTVHLSYDSSRSGPARTAIYAAKTDAQNNKYRNVLLQLEDPIPNGYGTLMYVLRSATFAK